MARLVGHARRRSAGWWLSGLALLAAAALVAAYLSGLGLPGL